MSTRTTVRTYWVAIRSLLVFTVALGIVYPLVVTLIGQLAFPAQSNGSLVRDNNGQAIGSSLIGQSWTDDKGNPLPQWFQSRPSAAGTNGYDASTSGGSNLGPENPTLVKAIAARRTAIAQFNGVPESEVPADAVTASASGLDPEISVAYANIQVNRVAKARGLSPDAVQALVQRNTAGRDLGYLGEPGVNVLTLNQALVALH